jgi:hypothetical protein
MKGVGVSPTEQKQSLSLLMAFGVTESVARSLARDCDPERVKGWIRYTEQAKGLHSPVAFVVSKLRAGEDPPQQADDTEDRQRYLEWVVE